MVLKVSNISQVCLTNVLLKVGKLTGSQLQQLLKHLPDGVTYGLDLEKEAT